MSVIRPLLIILLLLNLLAFAATTGWLGSSAPRGEPERLTNQIHPERIILRPGMRFDEPPSVPPPPGEAPPFEVAPIVLPDPALAAAATPEGVAPQRAKPPDLPACVAFENLSDTRVEQIRRVADAQPAAAVTVEMTTAPTGWWVLIPPAASLDAAERRERELRDKGVSDLYIVRGDSPNQFAISLGLFRTESRAQQHLSDLRAKGIEGAQTAPRDSLFRLELIAPASRLPDLAERLMSLDAELVQVPCTS